MNHFQGQILYVDHAEDGRHYAVADPVWAEKPVMMINGFQFAYFINSLVNGGAVGQKQSKRKSPLGFDVEVTDRYYKFSEMIDNGSYDLSDSNYAFLARQNVSGLFSLPRMSGSRLLIMRVRRREIERTTFIFQPLAMRLPFPCLPRKVKIKI